MHRSVGSLISWLVIMLAGCASSQPKSVEAPSGVAASALRAEQLHGFWAEYWARDGKAETQRYVFLADGRFGWLAPLRDVPQQDPQQRSGHFSVEGNQLVLQVARERFAACTGGCPHAGEARVVEHTAPLRISLELGDCPQNEEAAHLDPAYQCRSIGGRAFWHRAAPDAQDAAPFLQ